MKKQIQKYRLACILGACLALAGGSSHAGPGAHGPGGEHLDAPASMGASGLARLPDGSVNVPKRAQRRMEIRTQIGREAKHPRTVELNGRVAIDPNAGGLVQAPFSGRIEPGKNGLPVTGQRVARGQALLSLKPVANAVERGNQRAQLAEISAMRGLARQRVERLESLEGVVPRKEIEAASAELASLAGRERAIAASIGGSEAVTAPVGGVIASSKVLAGQIVEARDVLFEIVDPNRLLVEATTTDAALAGKIANAGLADLPQVELKLVGAARSLRDGALPLSFRASAKGAVLAVGQPVTVFARLSEQIQGIALPASAIVRNANNEPIVWIKSGAERFIAQPVEFLPLDAGTVVVTKGLAADNRVVVSGAALINQIR